VVTQRCQTKNFIKQGETMKKSNHKFPLLVATCSRHGRRCLNALAEVFAPQKLQRLILAGTLILSACATVAQGPDDLDIAIRDTSDYLNDNIPRASKIVILNIQSDYAALSDYIIDELIANAVNDRVFSVVDRAQLEQIRMELNFQMSGEVDDKSALEIGKFLGAQTIVSGAISELADRHRMRIRALNVQTAEVQGQYNRNISASKLLTALMKGGSYSGTTYGAAKANNNSGGQATAGSTTQAATRQPAGPKNGTYTLWPRPRAMMSGIPRDFYLPQIIVSNDYIVIYFSTRAEGEYRMPAVYNTHSLNDYIIQDLDNPSKFYSPVNGFYGGGQATIGSVSFRRFPATRFKFSIGYEGSEKYVWDEIILNEPDE
jgi:hypothetical protein